MQQEFKTKQHNKDKNITFLALMTGAMLCSIT